MVQRYSNRSKAKASFPPGKKIALFGPPLLLEGEEQAIYEEILARVRAALEPGDIIEEILADDLVASQWEAIRWRRLKSSLLSARGYQTLAEFLGGVLDYGEYKGEFERSLAERLQAQLTETEAEELARQYSNSEPNAFQRVAEILSEEELEVDDIMEAAQSNRGKQLARQYAARKAGATKQVDDLLSENGTTKDNLIAEALADDFEIIERFERLITLAEARRNASLAEIDRHRFALGQALRRTVQDIEHGEFRVIENKAADGKPVRGQRA